MQYDSGKGVLSYTLKKLLVKKVDNHYYSNYYRSTLDRYNEITTYCNLLKDIIRKSDLTIDKPIFLIRNKTFSQTRITDIKKRFGKPKFYLKNESPINKEIFFYHITLGKHRVNLEVHFHNKELFLYSYTFPYLNDTDKAEIVKVIGCKYLNEEKFDFQNFKIINDKNEVISIYENIVFTITYTCHTSAFFKNLSSFLEKQKAEKELYERENTQKLYDKL